ncbi:MAG: FAD-binding protein [Actinobacteria bacterium]|nr:FAD-binding protein [Actinomycetota bacterium]
MAERTDVLVIGGGPAGVWSAIAARRAGARAVLVDKGYCGTSGPAASGGQGVWYVPPDRGLREQAMASRVELGGALSERGWMERVLEETWRRMPELDDARYPFPVDDSGAVQRVNLQGPEYMRRMRRWAQRSGVAIRDHHPATALLRDADGAVAGAVGLALEGGEEWRVEASAVVLASGGCAFRSGAFGCHVDTGDGQLMAAELGAELSGMEFSNTYGLAVEGCTVTKNAYFVFASFRDADGNPIAGANSPIGGKSLVAEALLEGPVFARLDRASEQQREWIGNTQPNFMLPFARLGIDPLRDWFPVTLILEGTVRGTGGLRLLDERCATTVPGLFACGDAATRELISGGFTGGGSHNAAWTISSGNWAGAAAAEHALAAAGGASRGASTPDRLVSAGREWRETVAAVRAEVTPYDRNLFRTDAGLAASLERLDHVWRSTAEAPPAPAGRERLRSREAAAMLATARWMYRAARRRRESRGMHVRLDAPGQRREFDHRQRCGGLDQVWVEAEATGATR